MPHLMFEWVFRRARERWPDRAVLVTPVPGDFPTPYDRQSGGPDETRYVSWADWICPTHCIRTRPLSRDRRATHVGNVRHGW